MRREVAEDIRTIFNAPDRETTENYLQRKVEKYENVAPRLADWMEVNIPEGFTVFAFPKLHQRRLRTSNFLERLSQEIRRRTRIVQVFPNESSCLRLISAILMETNDKWGFFRIYLRIESS
jgi:transposase-like protein